LIVAANIRDSVLVGLWPGFEQSKEIGAQAVDEVQPERRGEGSDDSRTMK